VTPKTVNAAVQLPRPKPGPTRPRPQP